MNTIRILIYCLYFWNPLVTKSPELNPTLECLLSRDLRLYTFHSIPCFVFVMFLYMTKQPSYSVKVIMELLDKINRDLRFFFPKKSQVKVKVHHHKMCKNAHCTYPPILDHWMMPSVQKRRIYLAAIKDGAALDELSWWRCVEQWRDQRLRV